MSEEAKNQDNKYKRKRKKTFLGNARKYAKKGCFGRGAHLDPEIYQYFVLSMEEYNNGFKSDEDKQFFVENFFNQTVDQEVNCSCNQVGCRIIETLLPFAPEPVLDRWMEAFGKDLRPLFCDRFASHVLEALICRACTLSLEATTDSEYATKCKNFTLKTSKFLLNNLEDYMWDTYSNHVIRTCLENLARIPKEKAKVQEVVPAESSPDYLEVVQDFGTRIIHWPQFSEMCGNELTSGFLQVLLRALAKVDVKLLKKYIKKFVKEIFAPEGHENVDFQSFPKVFLSTPAVMLLETSLQVATPKLYTQIYASCFVERLAKLAVTRNTNFAVQKLIAGCQEKVEFEAIIEELKDHFKEIASAGHTGILMNLAQGCKRFATKQGLFVQSLMQSLDCSEPEERQNDFVLCLCRFQPYDPAKKNQNENLHKEKLNLHGTLILQAILEFNKPIKIINGILSLDTDTLKGLFSNTMGSHVVDSYVKSAFVGEKSREKLVWKMKGTFQDLVASKYGSRSFEAIWAAANPKSKNSIMEELAYKDGAWSNSEHGKIIANKVNLAMFKRSKAEWTNWSGFNKAKVVEKKSKKKNDKSEN